VNYKIIVKPSAQKDLDNLQIGEVKKIVRRINQLITNPRPVGVQKLSDDEGYRIRIGNYRILFTIKDKEKSILIYRIKHRKDAYK
jgi:mRNA interferase RelE/StbE